MTLSRFFPLFLFIIFLFPIPLSPPLLLSSTRITNKIGPWERMENRHRAGQLVAHNRLLSDSIRVYDWEEAGRLIMKQIIHVFMYVWKIEKGDRVVFVESTSPPHMCCHYYFQSHFLPMSLLAMPFLIVLLGGNALLQQDLDAIKSERDSVGWVSVKLAMVDNGSLSSHRPHYLRVRGTVSCTSIFTSFWQQTHS